MKQCQYPGCTRPVRFEDRDELCIYHAWIAEKPPYGGEVMPKRNRGVVVMGFKIKDKEEDQ